MTLAELCNKWGYGREGKLQIRLLKDDYYLLDPHGTLEDSWEWEFDDYGITWFTDYNEAEKALLDDVDPEYLKEGEKCIVERMGDDYYELRSTYEYDG